jgi:quercetin dioxygenase-like cupin family protein
MTEELVFGSDALGLRVRVLEDGSGSDGDLARAEVTTKAGGNGGPPHIHLRQEERFLVQEGALAVRRGRERLRVSAGEEVRIPARAVHTFRAEETTAFTAEFRPALRVIAAPTADARPPARRLRAALGVPAWAL